MEQKTIFDTRSYGHCAIELRDEARDRNKMFSSSTQKLLILVMD